MRVASYALVDTAAIAIPIGSAKVSILSTNGIGENITQSWERLSKLGEKLNS